MYIKDLSRFAEKVSYEAAKESLFRDQSSHFILDALDSSETKIIPCVHGLVANLSFNDNLC